MGLMNQALMTDRRHRKNPDAASRLDDRSRRRPSRGEVSKLGRRLRGPLGVGLTWGVFWSAIGAWVGLVIGVLSPEAWQLANPMLEWAIGMGLYGLVSGIGFGCLLSLREGQEPSSSFRFAESRS